MYKLSEQYCPLCKLEKRERVMFEGDYCPNCDNYIRALEVENDEMRKEKQALREAIEGALSAMTLGEAENILNAALKQGEE